MIVGFLCLLIPISMDAIRVGNRFEVTLTVAEPVGVDRIDEPVTSGVPLPRGRQKETEGLLLIDESKNKPIPCQFTVLSRWPDGSIKWVLLDFFCTVKANENVEYLLRNYLPEGKKGAEEGIVLEDVVAPEPEQPVNVQETEDSVLLDTGPLKLSIDKKHGLLIREAFLNGRKIISEEDPCEAVLKIENGEVYRTGFCVPDLVEVEDLGPVRAQVRVRGKFLNENEQGIFDGKVGYELRITAYAGKPYVRLAFTLENDGNFSPRKGEWLYFKSLRLDFPVGGSDSLDLPWRTHCSAGDHDLASEEVLSLIQWFKYPALNKIGWHNYTGDQEREREKLAGMKNETQGFYYLLTGAADVKATGEKAEGWAKLSAGDSLGLTVHCRRFRQNFPRGFELAPGRLSVLLWPEGGVWPRSRDAVERASYQFEGKRYKTAQLLIDFAAASTESIGRHESLEHGLVARASTDWYGQTGTIWPLAPVGVTTGNAQTDEAISRYDRLQLAKVHTEIGDPAGPIKIDEGTYIDDQWGKVSIPSLRDRCPDVFCGFMNFGDLSWGYGYCSLFYEWPYAMLLQHLRFGDLAMFRIAGDMVRHRYDIDRGPSWQRYEKGHHGNYERKDVKKRYEGEFHPRASHTWNRGLLLHWALTGDPRSYDAAVRVGEAYHNFWYGRKKLNEKDIVDYKEFRTLGWTLEAWLALYEYTGDPKYLEWGNEIFTKSLLAMEKKRGSCGHIVYKGRQSAQFVSFIVEPVARLHYYTGRSDVAGFLKRVLDWQRKLVLDGVTHDGRYRPIRFVDDCKAAKSHPDGIFVASRSYNFLFADGYAYLYRIFGRTEDLRFARQIFRDSVFFYGIPETEISPHMRTPLGYHFQGDIDGMCAKIQAWSGRYHQIYLAIEDAAGRIR